MCLTTNQKEPLIVTEDIICYKTVNIDSGTIISEYQKFIYDLDKLYETEFKIIGNKILYEINDGFHSYPISEYERIKNQKNCVKCIIPKDSEYHIGKYDGYDCYCSNKIIIKEIVSDRNRNQLIYGKKEGYWEEYYNNGNLWKKGNYKDGNEDGIWEHYYSNEKLHFKGNYKNGEQDGYWEEYFSNGKLMSKGNYKNDLKNGYWEEYWNNGKLESKGNYENGKFDGPWEFFHANGNLRYKGNYKDGKKESN